MSIPFGKHFGATFREAVIILEALEKTKFDDLEKEKVRRNTIFYIKDKLWKVYPYQCEDYFHKNPTPRKPHYLKEELERDK